MNVYAPKTRKATHVTSYYRLFSPSVLRILMSNGVSSLSSMVETVVTNEKILNNDDGAGSMISTMPMSDDPFKPQALTWMKHGVKTDGGEEKRQSLAPRKTASKDVQETLGVTQYK